MPLPARSVKIGSDERTGWSSDRPRRDGEPERPRALDVRARCRVLAPTERLRYSPGSLVVVVGAEPGAAGAFAARVLEDSSAVLAPEKVRALLAGKVAPEEVEEKVIALLRAAAAKRLAAGESVVVPLDGLDPEARAELVRLAAEQRRPRHLVLLETGRDRVPDEERAALNELRSALDSGGLGEEGFYTAVRLGGRTVADTKRIVFAAPPADD